MRCEVSAVALSGFFVALRDCVRSVFSDIFMLCSSSSPREAAYVVIES